VFPVPLLEVRDLNVRYRISRYTVAGLTDRGIVGELTRYMRILEAGNFDAVYDNIKASISREIDLYRSLGFFNVYALNDISINVREGTILAIVGESGCGKSTLARTIIRVLPPNATVDGEVILEGENLLELPEIKLNLLRAKQIGYIGQGSYTYLNPLMTSAYQIFESAIVAKEDFKEATKSFLEAIENIDIDTKLLLSFPERLSSGQIRRVAFAIAMAKEPKLLICDEPFRNLDVYHAKQLAYLLRELIGKFDTTALIFTHNISLMAEIADEMAIMYHGTIVERGAIEDIFRQPYHPYSKGLIGALPDIRNPRKRIVYVPGEPLLRIIRPAFCPFFNRCPIATEECMKALPKPSKFDGRLISCVRVDEVWDKTPSEFWGPYIN